MKQFLSLIFIFIGSYQCFSQEVNPRFLRGEVFDTQGSPIAGAVLNISSKSGKSWNCVADKNGRFECSIGDQLNFRVKISADGFSPMSRDFESSQNLPDELKFVLSPAGFRENVIVTTSITESSLSDNPASVVSLPMGDIKSTASPAIDDALRQTVGFSLFRRSNSRNANPTTQGTSLRGVNASGASRTRVSDDGIRLNDPFGGWIPWSSVATIGVERIEVLRGGASGLYGTDALGGAINIIRQIPNDDKLTVSAEIFGGGQETYSASVFVGYRYENWVINSSASAFQTRGYKIVEEASRGLVDDYANSKNTNFSARIGRRFGDRINGFIKGSYFGEARNNGTPVQKNRTHFRKFAAGFDLLEFDSGSDGPLDGMSLAVRAYGGTQVFDQTFSAVAADRDSERLVRLQRVPSQFAGFFGTFTATINDQTLLAGFETREVRGSSDETGFFGGNASSRLGSGGRERTYGAYFQDFVKAGEKLVFVGNIRFDFWENYRGLKTLVFTSSNQTTTTIFPERSESAFSPGGSVLFRATKRVSFYGNASRSFRAPTLNELYRGFRVGSTITDPNENLKAEKALNFEAGSSYTDNYLYLRGNFFWTRVSDSIANITLNSTPSLIFRQRLNAGTIKVIGFEAEAEAKIMDFGLKLGYLYAESKFDDFPANRTIEGLTVPQVPNHQVTIRADFRQFKGWNLSVQSRAASEQFDNDLNTLRLEPYFYADVFAGKSFKENWQVFFAVENILNSRYSIGKTPVRTVGTPINFRIGLRWN